MTTLVKPNQVWSSMPGWGIVADLTPPELVLSRRLRLIRRQLAAVLALVLVLILAGVVYAIGNQRSATRALEAEQARTQTLTQQQASYRGVTQVQASTDSLNGQLAGLMSADVDVHHKLDEISSALPAGMRFTGVELTINGAGTAAAAATGTTSGSSLDTSGAQPIGNIKLDGYGVALTDIAAYIDEIRGLDGVTDVVPTNINRVDGKIQFTILLTLTDKLFTHRFDIKAGSR